MHPGLLSFRLAVGAILLAACYFELFLLRTYLPGLARSADLSAEGFVGLGVYTIAGLAVFGGVALAVALLWRAADLLYARALALFVALLAYVGTVDGRYHFRIRPEVPGWASLALDATTPLALLFAVAALIWFSGLFPQPLTGADLAGARFLRRTRLWFLRGGFRWRAVLLLFAVAESVVILAKLPWSGASVAELTFALLKPLLVFLLLVGFTASVLNLHAGYRAADEPGRRRIFWVLEGILVGTTLIVLSSAVKLAQMVSGLEAPVRYWYELLLIVSVLVMIACLSIATFFSGAIDPRLTIRRTVVAGAVGVAMVFVFAGVEQLVQERLAGWLGLSDRLGGMLTGGTVALTFDPIRRRVSRAVDAVARWWGGEPRPDALAVRRGPGQSPLVSAIE